MKKDLPKSIHIRSLCERKFLFIMFLSDTEASNDFWCKVAKPARRDTQTISFPNENIDRLKLVGSQSDWLHEFSFCLLFLVTL